RTMDNELKRDFIKFDRLQVTGMDYQATPADSSKPASLHIHDVLARALYARVIIEQDQTTNIARILRLPPKTDKEGSEAATAKSGTASANASVATPAAAAGSAASPGQATAKAEATDTHAGNGANDHAGNNVEQTTSTAESASAAGSKS